MVTFSGKTILAVLFSLLLLAAHNAKAQSNRATFGQAQNLEPALPASQLLPDRLGARWRAVNSAQVLDIRKDTRKFSRLHDSDVYKEYGLQRIVKRAYTDGKSKISVEVFETNFLSNAYGLFTYNRGRLPENSHEFYDGRYLVKANISSPSGGNELLDNSLFEAIKSNIVGGEGQLPSLPLHLPENGKVRDSEKYIIGPAALAKLNNFSALKNVVNFDVGVEVVTAEYHNGDRRMSLIIIEYQTPQLASDEHSQIQGYFSALPESERSRQIVKRIGNYVVAALNVEDMPAAEKIVGQIKYEKKVYWAGRKFTDIPLEYRPPDPVAIEEATRTTQVLLRSFYWMGAMLLSAIILGLIAGAILFAWNLHRRRKLGLDDLFSDAGGTIRLNLDDYFLSDKSQVKQIDKGDQGNIERSTK